MDQRERADKIEPAEPMDRIEPDEPIDRIDLLDPMLRIEPECPGECGELAEIRITTFWQAGDQPGHLGLSVGMWPHRAWRSRTERHERAFPRTAAMYKYAGWAAGRHCSRGLLNDYRRGEGLTQPRGPRCGRRRSGR